MPLRLSVDTLQLVRTARDAEVRQLPGREHELFLERELLLRRLELWRDNFSEICSAGQSRWSPQEDLSAKVLLVYYESALVWVSTCLQSETAADEYMDRFQRIVHLAGEFISEKRKDDLPSATYSFELGMVAPMFMTGWKCRDPAIRRRALDLICQGPKQEALFSAQMHAKALEKIIEIEEDSTIASTEQSTEYKTVLPPERLRIRNATVHYETWEGKKARPALVFDQSLCDVKGTPTLLQKTVLL